MKNIPICDPQLLTILGPCLDGSNPGFYIRKTSTEAAATKWKIHIQVSVLSVAMLKFDFGPSHRVEDATQSAAVTPKVWGIKDLQLSGLNGCLKISPQTAQDSMGLWTPTIRP